MSRKLKLRAAWAGVDEAGRAPLAGPVYAAAVILTRSFDLEGIDDSKKLTPLQREEAAERIKQRAVFCVARAEVEEIETMNILWASLLAMRRALDGLPKKPKGVLIDGNKAIPQLYLPHKCVIGGDAKYAQIAAASILAKVHRDAYMREMATQYPEYGFERHFGYPTPEHLDALLKCGPCEIHRKTFARCREEFEQLCLVTND